MEFAVNLFLQDRYRLIRLIGSGEFVKTFLALDESKFPTFFCVIKEFLFQRLWDREELEKLLKLPLVWGYFEENGRFYCVEEFIEGKNLGEVLVEEGTFNEETIWQVLREVLLQLKVLHNGGLIHGDIKPVNLIRSKRDFKIILVDCSSVFLESNLLTGSAEFVAPEQVKGRRSFASDLYSLGVCCIYLLTGISPFQLFDVAGNCWVWRDYLTMPISEGLGEILDKMVENTLLGRFLSVDPVIEEINKKHPLEYKNNSTGFHVLQAAVKNSLWECRQTLGGFLGPVNSVAINSKNGILGAASDDKTIRLWNLNNYQLIKTIGAHSHFIKAITFSFDGKFLVSASDDKTVKIYDVETGQEVHTFNGHSHGVKTVAFHPEGEILASGSWDKTIKLWDINKKVEICSLKHNLQVTAVAFSPDGKWLASASFDRTIRVWDMGGKLRFVLADHIWPVFAVAFSPNSKILATGSDDKTIKLWDVESGSLIRTISAHSWTVVSLVFSGDGEFLISGSWDKNLKLWQVSSGEEIEVLGGHLDSVCGVAVDSLGEIIVSGSKDKTVKIWQMSRETESVGRVIK